MSDEMREKFEKHWKDNLGVLHITLGMYDLMKAKAWSAWQAALASQPTEGIGERVVEEWEQSGLTPQEMWDEIQAIRRITGDDGTHGSPHVLVEELINRVAAPSMTLDLTHIPQNGGANILLSTPSASSSRT